MGDEEKDKSMDLTAEEKYCGSIMNLSRTIRAMAWLPPARGS